MVYRRLLRAVRASVKFHKPAASNLRRALRGEFVAALSNTSGDPADVHFEHSARNTIALLLSSAFSPRRDAFDTSHIAGAKVLAAQTASARPGPSTATSSSLHKSATEDDDDPTLHHTLAHKVVENLASLVYHHLSPHTQMQPLSKRGGGTQQVMLVSGRTSSRSRSSSNSQNDIALDVMGGDGPEGDWTNQWGRGQNDSPFSGEYRIPSLQVSSKPVRGPMGQRPNRWDGQKPMSVFLMQQQQQSSNGETTSTAKSSDSLTALQNRVLYLVERYRASREAEGESSNRTQKLLQEVRQVRGVLRSATKKAEQEERKRAVEKLPQQWLHDLVRNAEESGEAWLGGQRFGKWNRGEWLPP
ncbi:hypothetical protein CF335_g4974 [Tilletia laevis]|nr:hypothetical protein CF335_g4974 [Tilletia laevis]